MKLLKLFLYPLTISATLYFTGCSLFGVYKIDLPQGTPITHAQAQKIQPGMSQNEVLYHLGSPALTDTLAPNRWDYIYDYTPGTYGEREGKQIIRNASQHLIIYFNDNKVVSKVEGIDTLPTKLQ